MSKRDKPPAGPPGFAGTLIRLGLTGVILFCASGIAGYGVIHHLVKSAEVQAPDLLTFELQHALQSASDQGFPVRIAAWEATELLESNHVIAQRPMPGEWIKPGATILVTVAK